MGWCPLEESWAQWHLPICWNIQTEGKITLIKRYSHFSSNLYCNILRNHTHPNLWDSSGGEVSIGNNMLLVKLNRGYADKRFHSHKSTAALWWVLLSFSSFRHHYDLLNWIPRWFRAVNFCFSCDKLYSDLLDRHSTGFIEIVRTA